MLKHMTLPTPDDSPSHSPRGVQHSDEQGEGSDQIRLLKSVDILSGSAVTRTFPDMPEGYHNGSPCVVLHSEEEDVDSSDSDDVCASSRPALRARSVKSAQKGVPVTSMSKRRDATSEVQQKNKHPLNMSHVTLSCETVSVSPGGTHRNEGETAEKRFRAARRRAGVLELQSHKESWQAVVSERLNEEGVESSSAQDILEIITQQMVAQTGHFQRQLSQSVRTRENLEARVRTLELDLTDMRKLFVREGHRQQRRFDRILLRCSSRMLRWFLESWATHVWISPRGGRTVGHEREASSLCLSHHRQRGTSSTGSERFAISKQVWFPPPSELVPGRDPFGKISGNNMARHFSHDHYYQRQQQNQHDHSRQQRETNGKLGRIRKLAPSQCGAAGDGGWQVSEAQAGSIDIPPLRLTGGDDASLQSDVQRGSPSKHDSPPQTDDVIVFVVHAGAHSLRTDGKRCGRKPYRILPGLLNPIHMHGVKLCTVRLPCLRTQLQQILFAVCSCSFTRSCRRKEPEPTCEALGRDS